jgi:hypothetical protein
MDSFGEGEEGEGEEGEGDAIVIEESVRNDDSDGCSGS